MATETTGGFSDHMRGVTVTTVACLAGVAAALVSGVVVGTDPAAASDVRVVAVLAAFVLGQFPLLTLAGIEVTEFGVKDHLYLVFMTFTLWFVTFAILLSAGVSL